MLLAASLFVRIDVVHRKLENRIQGIEDDMQGKVQRMVQATLQSYAIPTTRKGTEKNDATNNLEAASAPPHTHTKCPTGPNPPQYLRIRQSQRSAPLSWSTRTRRGKQGPEGTQGIKGQKGEKGSTGSLGAKGDVGPVGRPGIKGSTGFKGNKGNRGAMGLQGPKGHLVVSPKIHIFPLSQDVFINKSAIFYCWVDGHTTTKTTWRKLGGALIDDVKNGDVLHIRNVKKSHAGSYLCSAFTGYGIFRAISTLSIKEPPMFTKKPPAQVFADLGSTLTLCCEADGSVSWTRAEQPLNLLSAFQQNGCLTISHVKEESAGKYTCRAANNFGFSESTTTVIVTVGKSCEDAWSKRNGSMKDGEHFLAIKNQFFKVYCDMGWTLIARFSNNDPKNWMDDQGTWWYDRRGAVGNTTDPSINADMISPAFWLASGREFKITRNDDPGHIPLLWTTSNCLAGKTFRSKLTSYGDFRHGNVWSNSNRCRGSCMVKYGGRYESTQGFYQAKCSSDMQSANRVGFWCKFYSEGSVMMIGGGGSGCSSADHGIGIASGDSAFFVRQGHFYKHDFGYDVSSKYLPVKTYSLNLWIR
ncbi:hypothetical protein ACROYT_G002210 [Oculina patagonica]